MLSGSKKDPDFDRELEQRFGHLLALAYNDQLDDWCVTPRSRLALIVVLDRFSRNIHRGPSRSFEADPKVLVLTVNGIDNGSDQYALNQLEIIAALGRFPHRNVSN